MKKNNNSKYIIGLLLVLAVGIFFTFSDDNQFGDNSLVTQLSFVDVGGNQIDIECKIKQTTTVIDNTGNFIAEIQSNGIIGSPTANNLFSPQGDEVSTFVIIPKIFCTTQGSNITVEKSDLRLIIEVGSYQQTQNIRYQTDLKFTTQGGEGEKNLGWFSLSDNDIEAMIPERDFSGTIEFHVMGNVDIHYDIFPSNTMTIPIQKDDMPTQWQFTNKGANETIVDSDGDGILDNADACPSQRENYNGYQDHDGCPDVVPNTTETPIPESETEPTNQAICENNNRVWINGACVDQADSTPDTIPSAKIQFQIDLKFNDGTKEAYQVQDDPSPFDIPVSLKLTGGVPNGAVKQTAEFTINPRIIITDTKTHGLTDVTASNITIEPILTVVKDSTTNVYTMGKKPIQDFVPTNGGSVSDNSIGLSLGNIIVRASDIENTIPLSFVGLDESADVDIKFRISGEIDLIVNTGTFTEYNNIDITGADFDFKGFKIIRGTPTTSSNIVIPQCNADTEYLKALSGGLYKCEKIGTTGDETGGNGGTCTPDSGAGDSNGDGVICQICVDDGAGAGGFPCTDNYRERFCSDTTQCGTKGNDGTEIISDNNNDGVIDKKDAGIPDASCPITPLSLSDNACVVSTGTSVTGGDKGIKIGEKTICFASGGDPCGFDTGLTENEIIIILGVIGGIGILGAVLRKKQNSGLVMLR